MVGDHIFWLVFMAEIRSRHALLVRLPLFAPHITYLWLMFDIRLPSRDLIADSIEAVCNLVHFLFLDPALAHHTSLCVTTFFPATTTSAAKTFANERGY